MTSASAPYSADSPERESTRKRARTALACEECRDRKRKCDGVKPVCGACSRRSGRRCVWNEERNSKGWWSNSYVEGLKSQIRQLEEAQAAGDSARTPGTAAPENTGVTLTPTAATATAPAAAVLPPPMSAPPSHPGNMGMGFFSPLPSRQSISPTAMNNNINNNNTTTTTITTNNMSPRARASVSGLSATATAPPVAVTASLPPPHQLESPGTGFRGAAGAAAEEDLDAVDTDETEPEVDGMGVLGSINVNDVNGRPNDPRSRRLSDYFGPSSTMGLLTRVRRTMCQKCCEQDQPGSWTSGSSSTLCPEDNNNFGSAASSRGQSGRGRDSASRSGFMGKTVPSRSFGFGSGSGSGLGFGFGFGFTVPPRLEADSLVESYWVSVHSLYPFLHRPSLEGRYAAIWDPQPQPQPGPRQAMTMAMSASMGQQQGQRQPFTGYYENTDEKLFYCLINVVFALGALFNRKIDPQDRDNVSRSFFDRAKQLLDLDLLANGSVALVQTLLLMGQYLQSTDMSSSCWNIIGLAIRVAQCIGLHHEPRGCGQGSCAGHGLDQVELEMRRRAWTGCVLLDRVLSLTYGRPLMIHPTTTQDRLALPSAIDDHFLTSSSSSSSSLASDSPGSQAGDVPSLTACYVEAIKLQDILGQVLATFYYGHNTGGPGSDDSDARDPRSGTGTGTGWPSHPKTTTSPDLQKLLSVDNLLNAWHKALPTHLKLQTYAGESETALPPVDDPERLSLFRKQATVLEARYLHTRLVMLRPNLSVLCDSASRTDAGGARVSAAGESIESNIHQDMLLKAGNMCVLVAQDLLQLITGNMDSQRDLLPAPWYNVFYIHSSALVFLISLLCSPNQITCANESSLMECWNRCITFLKSYGSCSRSARRCSKILKMLELEVFRFKSGGDTVMGSPNNPQQQQQQQQADGPPFEPEGVAFGAAQDQGFSPGDEDLSSMFFHDFSRVDVSSNAWVHGTSDMAWLSLAPFLEDNQGGTV